MRLAWHRDFCSVTERLRSSASAWALNGPSRASLAVPVSSAMRWTAISGSISSLTSLKRTDGVGSWAGAGDAILYAE
jgi:hypothetical protein